MAQPVWSTEYSGFKTAASAFVATLQLVASKHVDQQTQAVADFDTMNIKQSLGRIMRGYVRTLYAGQPESAAKGRVAQLVKAVDAEIDSATKATSPKVRTATSYQRVRTRYPRSRESEQRSILNYRNETRREELTEIIAEALALISAVGTLGHAYGRAAVVFGVALATVESLLVALVESCVRLNLVSGTGTQPTSESLILAATNIEMEMHPR